MRIEDLVKAAQEYDLKTRPKIGNWSAVPDSQVARLLKGAFIALKSQRRAVPVPEE